MHDHDHARIATAVAYKGTRAIRALIINDVNSRNLGTDASNNTQDMSGNAVTRDDNSDGVVVNRAHVYAQQRKALLLLNTVEMPIRKNCPAASKQKSRTLRTTRSL